MPLVKWSPLGDSASWHDRINRIFDEAFPRTGQESELAVCDWNPVIDSYEKDGVFIIEVELPGIDKKDVAINLKNRMLSIIGQRFFNQDIKEENYHRRERCYGTFHRSFILPVFVRPEDIKAEFKDGVLKVKIPKPKEEKLKQILIK